MTTEQNPAPAERSLWAPTHEDREVLAEAREWLRSLTPQDLDAETLGALEDVADMLAQVHALEDANADPEAIAFLVDTTARLLIIAQVTHERATGEIPAPQTAMSADEVHRLHVAPYMNAAYGVCKRVRRRAHHRPPAVHVRPRRRGAGRPRAQATRSSARSGDSGEDGSEPPPHLRPHLRLASPPRAVYAFGCLSPAERGEVSHA